MHAFKHIARGITTKGTAGGGSAGVPAMMAARKARVGE